MKFLTLKNHLGTSPWMKILQKTFLCLVLFVPLSLLNSCSGDDDGGDDGGKEPPIISPTPQSIGVGADNKNMPSSGLITSEYSDSPSGANIGKIVDNDVNTAFVTPHSKFYIIWAGNKNVAINNYTLTSSADAAAKDPKSWTLSGSDDQKSWTLLDTQTSQSFAERKGTKEYDVKNKVEYKYYKLDIHGNNGDASTQIAEFTLRLKLDPNAPYSVKIPLSTKNMPVEGTITSQYSDFPSGSHIGAAMDNNMASKFVTNHNQFYILWEGNEKTVLNYYSLTSAQDSPEKDPKSWTLSASNDQTAWKVLDTKENSVFNERSEMIGFDFDNEIAYKYYRLDIKANNGGASTQIAELTMDVLRDLAYYKQFMGGYTHSNVTPMGNYFENRHKTTDADRAWFADASKDAVLPESDDRKLTEFKVNLYPFGDPIPADVNQRGIGNCCAVAVFASMAYQHPEFIKSIIKDNGDKTYTVSMFDPEGEPLKVGVNSKFLADKNGGIIAGTGKNGVPSWVTILEKAMMKYNAVYKINGNYDLGGIGTEHVPPLFTRDGDSFSINPGKLSAKDLARLVKLCLLDGKYVIGGFNKGDLPVDGSKTVTYHAYSFMHSDGWGALFAMRNPWGGNPDVDGKKDGMLHISSTGGIAPTIDLRVVEPGLPGHNGATEPYYPPKLDGKSAKMHVADYLLRPTMRR